MLKDFVSDQVLFVRHRGQNTAVIAGAAQRHCERSDRKDGKVSLAVTVGFLVWGLYSPACMPFL